MWCNNNQITSFKYLPDNIKKLRCQNCKITSYEYLPKSITWLQCCNNFIINFESFPDCTMHFFKCDYNYDLNKIRQKYELIKKPVYD
jgi:Leucine-rich repeat (LRR) protein